MTIWKEKLIERIDRGYHSYFDAVVARHRDEIEVQKFKTWIREGNKEAIIDYVIHIADDDPLLLALYDHAHHMACFA